MVQIDMLVTFLKFAVVGFSGVFVDFGITYILKEKLGVQKYLSNSIGFICAASSNYLFNRIWTFQSENPQILIEYGQFILIALVGLLINNLIIAITVEKFKANFYFAKLLAIGITTIWNFAANNFVTFAG